MWPSHHDQRKTQGNVSTFNELGKYVREVDQLYGAEHDVEWHDDYNMPLPYEGHQMGAYRKCGSCTPPGVAQSNPMVVN